MGRSTGIWPVVFAGALMFFTGCGGGGSSGSGGGGDPTTALDGFGTVTGQVWSITVSMIDSTSSSTIRNTLDFGADPYDAVDLSKLTVGAQKIINDGGGGGSSLLSKAFSFDMLARCEGATLLKSESEITYTDPAGKKTTMLVQIDGRKVGVSVTRAVSVPTASDPYLLATAQAMLESYLQDILLSTANVAATDQWSKQILYVMAQSTSHADTIFLAWDQINATLKADTILIVTATEGDDTGLYY